MNDIAVMMGVTVAVMVVMMVTAVMAVVAVMVVGKGVETTMAI